MKIIFSQKCLEYRQLLHPESPQRIKLAYEYLKQKGYKFYEPSPCSDEEILKVHTEELLDSVRENIFFDPDTPNIKNIYEYAKLSAGASIMAAKFTSQGEDSLSLMRPPGHHSGKDNLGGFCYFNNVAIAVKSILDKINSIAILDIDAHHGNGTQDIFWGKENVLYVSLHEVPLFPGTGLISELNCLNFPLSAGTTEIEYLSVLEEALGKIKEFNPEMLAVSLGFDTYCNDPLANIKLEKESYFKIAQAIAKLDKRTFFVLEGGYSNDLGPCIECFLQGWGNDK